MSNDESRVILEKGAEQGNYFGNYFTSVDDPQKANVTTKDSLRDACMGLFALKDPEGNIVFQNPSPGCGVILVRTGSMVP